MRAAGWRKSADENIAREQGRRTFGKDSAIGQWVDRLVTALAFPLFLSVDSRVSETCLGRKRSCSLLLLVVFFHRFRGFLCASGDSLRGGHCFQAWQPFSAAPSRWP